ncbi:60S ribosomal protein L37a-like [Scyliorhinus canicula]|uniref:60S ribosomal protein L37a-like n=1 Tax=Scyliorhinus canicula TaxID=7830 RepID=UPI0018F359B2|nr:60S ribosomal protein L37a-like [Scyliorhinus canicula]
MVGRTPYSTQEDGKTHQEIEIVGKYGTQYGASLHKMVKNIDQLACKIQHLLWQTKMKRRAVCIWHCGSCMKTVAGGTWTYTTTLTVTVKSAICHLLELKDQ